MKTVSGFLIKFASLIVAVLHCFDRVLFKGHLPLARAGELEFFVDQVLRVRRDYFLKKLAPTYSDRLVAHAQNLARRSSRPYLYRTGKFRKDAWAATLLRQQPVREGLIAVLCTLETCPSFRLVYGDKRPRFQSQLRQQRVLYYYLLDRDLGIIHVRLQTWFPFTIQVCVNGHDWLAQQMVHRGLGFVQRDNAFTQLDQPQQAQRLADRFPRLNWPRLLNRLARQANPLLPELRKRYSGYYWVIDQAEFATDLLFTAPTALAGLYRRLLQFALLTFSPRDVLGFLARRSGTRFDGEVCTELKDRRWSGTRLKHRVGDNWLKLYDKFGLILRVETVINDPSAFKVYRACHHHDGSTSRGWYPMPKGVSFFPEFQRHAFAANHRYLEALALVNDPTPAYADLAELTQSKRIHDRCSAGFQPTDRRDVCLFAAILDGNHIAQGFRNADIRAPLFADPKNTALQRRQSTAVSRLLKRLHVRALVAKVPRSHRWKVTPKGRRLLTAALHLYSQHWPELLTPAA